MAATFTTPMIEKMRSEWGSLDRIDPCLPTYAKLIKLLDGMPQEMLKQLSEANIKFISMLARNRIK